MDRSQMILNHPLADGQSWAISLFVFFLGDSRRHFSFGRRKLVLPRSSEDTFRNEYMPLYALFNGINNLYICGLLR